MGVPPTAGVALRNGVRVIVLLPTVPIPQEGHVLRSLLHVLLPGLDPVRLHPLLRQLLDQLPIVPVVENGILDK